VRVSFRRAARWLGVAALTASTATAARWLRAAIAARPWAHEPGRPAADDPAAARDEQRLADTLLWRFLERRVALRAVRPLRERPTFRRLRVLNLDHGPGGVACALADLLPQDATLVAADSIPGMADLARHRARRRVPYRTIQFVRARPHALPFQDGAFDLVVSAGGLHQWPNPHAVLVEARRTLADGGRYFVGDLRRDLNLAQWLLVRLLQAVVVPRDLRAIDEPSSSIGAAYAPHEAEWLAARAQLPDLRITRGPGWLAIEPSSSAA
jgi:SAM-dependent methyltransferase